ncbi:unnamed protein product [Penicillium roqueforti FM164]|uniref:Uncharacterized protein n=1 Tax=Penicillium roqueforti (strain FM164) TaxID=1365484 RepID=W6QRU0_PENRF|nr:unnamed protein product [Penicillium roqueforti FM164]
MWFAVTRSLVKYINVPQGESARCRTSQALRVSTGSGCRDRKRLTRLLVFSATSLLVGIKNNSSISSSVLSLVSGMKNSW